MALITPRDLYTGGAVTFNSSPYVQFATNMMARKAAKDEALDNYYRNLNKSINPKGVRAVDVPGFMQRVNGLEGFWQQNKDAIKDPRLDNGKAQTEYNSRFQDIQGYTNSSKQEELKKQPFLSLLVDPDKRDRATPAFMNALHLHDLELDNPERQSLDPASAQNYFNPKAMEAADWQKYYKGVGEGITPDKSNIIVTPDPTSKYHQIETTVAQYSPDKLVAIGNQAKNDYDSDHRLQYNFEKTHPFQDWKKSNEGEFNKYNDIHRQVYGSDIQDDKDLHAAIVLSKKLEPTSVSKRVQDTDAVNDRKFAQQKELAYIRQATAAMNKGGGDGSGAVTGNALDDFPDVRKANYYTKDGIFYNNNGTPIDTSGGQTFITKEEMPATWISTLKAGGIDANKIRDGVYATIKDGQIQSIYNKNIGTVTRPTMQGVYQPKMDTEPLKGQHLKFGQAGNQPTEPKQYKHTATSKNGKKAYSNDGINWVDENGNPIK